VSSKAGLRCSALADYDSLAAGPSVLRKCDEIDQAHQCHRPEI